MKMIFNNYPQIKKILLSLFVSFLAVFSLRLGYEVFFTNRDLMITYQPPEYSNNVYFESGEYESRIITKNIATDKISQKDHAGQEIMIDQKYEKSANISARSTDFTNDNQTLRAIIKENDAVIQMENLTGLAGNQQLTMMIGVMPDNFDHIIEQIKPIGTLQAFMVNKEDKTAEFRSLLAEQETLKKTRDSYIAIKEKGGNIQDLLLLEDKILEVEQNLQNLGVNLGTYDTENSFCTINFTLSETAKSVQETSLKFVLKCAKRSFSWTVGIYALLGFLTLAILIMVVVYLKLAISIKKSLLLEKTGDVAPQNNNDQKILSKSDDENNS